MKDVAHHLKHLQRKVIRSTRNESSTEFNSTPSEALELSRTPEKNRKKKAPAHPLSNQFHKSLMRLYWR